MIERKKLLGHFIVVFSELKFVILRNILTNLANWRTIVPRFSKCYAKFIHNSVVICNL